MDAVKFTLQNLLSSAFAFLTATGVYEVSSDTQQWVIGVVGTIVTLGTTIYTHVTHKNAVATGELTH